MAHPYTTRVRVQKQARSTERVADLHDVNRDGVEDSIAAETILTEAIGSACELIDARLGQRYVVPFAAITDTPATPALVTRICNFLVLWEGYARVDPDSPDAKAWWSRADALMTGILDGSLHLDATQRSATVRRPVVYEAGARFAAGNVDNDYTTNGVSKLRGV
jgi:phage gp36-like protein